MDNDDNNNNDADDNDPMGISIVLRTFMFPQTKIGKNHVAVGINFNNILIFKRTI